MWSSRHDSAVMNPTSIHEYLGSIPGPTQQVKDLALLWLWCRLAAAALMLLLAWKLPYALGKALKRPKKKKVNEVNCRYINFLWVLSFKLLLLSYFI